MSAAELAATLALARRETRVLPDDPSGQIASVEDAYAVQAEIVRLANGDIRGWKVTGFTPADRAKYESRRPVAGPLLAPYVITDPASLSLTQFVTPLLECEVAFVLGKDLPARPSPYTDDEIASAIEAVLPGMEVVDSRIVGSATELARLADTMMNGAYVTGTAIADWGSFDLDNQSVVLSATNGEKRVGNSTRIPGGPFQAVVALANAQPLAGALLKGQVITTGSCIVPAPLQKGNYVGDFGRLGQVRLTVT